MSSLTSTLCGCILGLQLVEKHRVRIDTLLQEPNVYFVEERRGALRNIAVVVCFKIPHDDFVEGVLLKQPLGRTFSDSKLVTERRLNMFIRVWLDGTDVLLALPIPKVQVDVSLVLVGKHERVGWSPTVLGFEERAVARY